MRNRPSLPLILAASLVGAGLMACGDDGNTEGADETAGDGDGDPGDGDGAPGDGDGAPGDGDGAPGDGDGAPGDGDGAPGDGDGAPGDGDGAPGDGDGAPGDGDGAPGDCMVWEITYDLDGSEFEISGTFLGLGNQLNVVEEPYAADDTVGPGTFVLHFQDVNGAPGGQAFMNSYAMSMDFAVASPGVTVETNLENDAGPVECGITSGALEGNTVAWAPSAIVDHHSVGQILCTGNFCGQAMLPNGQPVPVDEVSDLPISDFDFSNDLSSFSMAQTVIQMDQNSTTSWMYMGTETSRELIAAPACLCQ